MVSSVGFERARFSVENTGGVGRRSSRRFLLMVIGGGFALGAVAAVALASHLFSEPAPIDRFQPLGEIKAAVDECHRQARGAECLDAEAAYIRARQQLPSAAAGSIR